MQAALLTVGDELLDGDTENANATWLSRRLTERGVILPAVILLRLLGDVRLDAVRDPIF